MPKPNVIPVVVSVTVIALNLIIISFAIAAFMQTWNPCAILSGVILLPLPMALVIQQYRGTFRRNRSAAKNTSTLLFVVSGFSAFAFVTTIGESILASGVSQLQLLLPLVATMLAISLGALFAGRLNLRWARCLQDAVDNAPSLRYSTRELLGTMTIIAAVLALSSWLHNSAPPKYAEHVELAEAPFGLPPEATDISFCQGFRGTIAFEFSIDEIGFREWVKSGIGSIESQSSDITLLPITTSVSIWRYSFLASELTSSDKITVSAGFQYSWSHEDRGVYAVFDSTTNRAYYFAHYH